MSLLYSHLGSRYTHSTEGNLRLTGDTLAPREKAEIAGPLPSLCSVMCTVSCCEHLWKNAPRTTLVWPTACHPRGARISGGGSAQPFPESVGGGHELPLPPVCCLILTPQAERALKKKPGFGVCLIPCHQESVFLSDLPALSGWPSSQWL